MSYSKSIALLATGTSLLLSLPAWADDKPAGSQAATVAPTNTSAAAKPVTTPSASQGNTTKSGTASASGSTVRSTSAGSTSGGNASASSAANGPSFEAFRIVVSRNIFNPNRYASNGRSRSDDNSEPPAPAFSFVGSLNTESGSQAFFDGNSSEYRKVLRVGGQIAGFTVTQLGESSVELTSKEGKATTLRITQGMTQGENNVWSPSFTSATSGSSGSSSASSSSVNSSSGSSGTGSSSAATAIPADASDTLRRLMEARQKQLKE